MANYGEYRRVKPRVNVLRGYPGNEPTSLTLSAKPKAAEGILSGQVISLDVNNEWVKGAATGAVAYIASQDQIDTDVVSSGLLLGFSCAGKFEIETAYFVADAGLAVNDVALKAGTSGNAGSLAIADWGDAVDILGQTSRGGVRDVAATNSQATLVNGVIETITFVTNWAPTRV